MSAKCPGGLVFCNDCDNLRECENPFRYQSSIEYPDHSKKKGRRYETLMEAQLILKAEVELWEAIQSPLIKYNPQVGGLQLVEGANIVIEDLLTDRKWLLAGDWDEISDRDCTASTSNSVS